MSVEGYLDHRLQHMHSLHPPGDIRHDGCSDSQRELRWLSESGLLEQVRQVELSRLHLTTGELSSTESALPPHH